MNTKTVSALVGAALAGLALTSTAATAAPAAAGIGQTFDKVPVTYVRWHGRRGWHRGYYGRRYGWHRRHYGYAPAVGLGLATGAIIGGAIAAQSAAPTVVYDGNAVAYCEQHFKSYDPASGTYLGYDGVRHPCP